MIRTRHTRRDFLRTAALTGAGAAAALGGSSPLIRPARAAQLEGPVNALTWGPKLFAT